MDQADYESVRIKRIAGENYTPYSLARKFGAAAILESATLTGGRDRYSLLLVEEAFRILQNEEGQLSFHRGADWKRVEQDGDILDLMEKIASQHSGEQHDFPFPAGGIGYLSFEFASKCDAMVFPKRHDSLNLPEAALIFGHVFIIFDHYTDEIILLGLNYKEHNIDLEKALNQCEEKIFDFDFNYLSKEPRMLPAEVVDKEAGEERYKEYVREIKKEIIKGNLLQCVPSRRLEVKSELTALQAYRNLRASNPSPYLFYLDFDSFQLFGASPEMHVKVTKDKALIRPIAGTRRRGKDNKEDIALEKELLADPKERAEHLMLVDLARNDLGRLSNPGTVKLTEFMTVERYSKLMHIVSQVEGEMKEGVTGADIIRKTFPAGTVSGAPKIQAVNTIAKLESEPRTFYAGLVGYFGPDHQLDNCITIRSAIKKDGSFFLQAGGGIVYDSIPERELEETNEKLRATALAIGLEV